MSGQTRYRMALETRGSGWSFTIVFEKFPAPELGAAARSAEELPHTPEFVLTHRILLDGSPAGTKERLFPEVASVEGGVRARLLLASLDERDLLYRALTEPAYATNLIVRRKARVAIRLLLADSAVPTLSSGTIALRPNQGLDLVTGTAAERSSAHIRWTSEKKIAPLGGVQLALLGKLDFDQVGFAMLKAAPHAGTELSSAAGWDANSVVNATPLWNPHGAGGVYDANSLGVWYTGSAWSIFHQNFQAMAANTGFVVTNSNPGSAIFVHRAQAALPQWTTWASLGAPATGFLNAPSSISRGPQVCNVYVRGGDRVLWQLPFFDGRWHGWAKHDGILLAEPAVSSMNPNHEQVFGQGTDGQLFQKWWAADGGWRGWSPMGAPAPGFVGRPATVSRSPQVWNVYVRGKDNALWQLAFHGRRRPVWSRHDDGGVLASPPAAGSMNSNHEHVFVRGTDGQVWVKWWLQASGWSAWAALGAPRLDLSAGRRCLKARSPVICSSAAKTTLSGREASDPGSGVPGSVTMTGECWQTTRLAHSFSPTPCKFLFGVRMGRSGRNFGAAGVKLVGTLAGTQPRLTIRPSTETQTPSVRQPRTGIRVEGEGPTIQSTSASTSRVADGQSSTRTCRLCPSELLSTFASRLRIGALFIVLRRTTFMDM